MCAFYIHMHQTCGEEGIAGERTEDIITNALALRSHLGGWKAMHGVWGGVRWGRGENEGRSNAPGWEGDMRLGRKRHV